MTLIKRPINEVIKELGLPADTRFLGYVIHLEASDEFLIRRERSVLGKGYLWGKGTPESAMRFQNPNQAISMVKKHGKDAVVGGLFETENQYVFHAL